MDKLKVLFVDDEAHVLTGLRRMFYRQSEEWEMSFAGSSREALALMKTTGFDVLVSDIRMPGMSGTELLREVKKLYPSIMRIVLSGQSARDTLLDNIGVTHMYLPKPSDVKTLKSAINRAMLLKKLDVDNDVKQLLSQLETLPSIPALYFEIIEELHKPEASINTIGDIISRDLGMSTRILQLANSAFFGFDRHITEPSHAVMLLGLDVVKAMVLLVETTDQFENTGLKGVFLKTILNHSMVVGTLAKRIAAAEGLEKDTVDYAFMSGLLHDLGQLVLGANLGDKYDQVLDMVTTKETTISEAEREIIGVTHEEAGAYLIGLWGLPEPVIENIAFHHCPEKSRTEEFSSLSAVYVADAIACEMNNCNITDTVLKDDDPYLSGKGLLYKLPLWRNVCLEGIHQKF